jgi:DNA-binding NarL/FixJ family response regulator
VEKIRVLIADDHLPFLEGLSRILNDEKEMEVIGKAADGEEAVILSKDLHPDVAIIDISMPKLDGIQAAKQIKESSPDTAVLMLSAFLYNSYVVASLNAGAAGYLTKDTPLPELVSAIHVINEGERIIGKRVAANFAGLLNSNNASGNPGLHPREVEVIKFTAKGMRNKEIASQLKISERTVQAHLANIFNKLGVYTRTEAVLKALKEGWLDICDLAN